MKVPNYIFESSWEVCNKVGGIYTVLSTRAKTLQDEMKDHVIFFGPDCWGKANSPYFIEDLTLFSDWRIKTQAEDGLKVKVGRWDIPGQPIAILVDFQSYFAAKDQIYGQLWEDFKVDSLHAYGDYDEANMFSYAAAKVVESFYHRNIDKAAKVIYHGNEWMTCLGLLYIRKHVPEIATIFTTHATSIGRSIAGNNKPLYEYLWAYNGDQMAAELNMQSKHSIEKQAAHFVDCFTTVSDITARECKELLDKPVDFVLPNGFENNFVPKGAAFTAKRKQARKTLLRVANALTGDHFDDDTLIISTSGRYEFRNKGIDVFIEAMNQLRFAEDLDKQVVAFIEVPGWVAGPREDLQERLKSSRNFDSPLPNPTYTHGLHDLDGDRVLCMMNALGMHNEKTDRVKIIFIPCYLTGQDGILNLSYYDVVLGNDLCVYPSYYEPWGYTPLEAVAFKVPCITTDLAGFGLWANQVKGSYSEIEDGVKVIHRTDYNYQEVAAAIKDTVVKYASLTDKEVKSCRSHADNLSRKALWSKFIAYYHEAYDYALCHAEARMDK
ncbi:glycogen/starch synthase [Segatella oris]|uniref:glycosyltransferase n=1 Tax=Segatella oris TaxID=28135 RepID=UPI0028E72621|nr:glycogen/starch synthase [Segatella oris]